MRKIAKLYSILAIMGEGKSESLIRRKSARDRKGLKTLALKPKVDNRNGSTECFICSRNGSKTQARWILDNENLCVKVQQIIKNEFKPKDIYVDEINFLSSNQIEQLRDVVDMFDINVFCYGLMTDFTSYMFESSKRLLEIGNRDCIEFLHDTCDSEGNKPIINARINNGYIIYNGNQIEVGDSQYIPQTYKNWKNGVIK